MAKSNIPGTLVRGLPTFVPHAGRRGFRKQQRRIGGRRPDLQGCEADHIIIGRAEKDPGLEVLGDQTAKLPTWRLMSSWRNALCDGPDRRKLGRSWLTA